MDFYDYNSFEKMGFTVQQHRAMNTSDSSDGSNHPVFIYANSAWGQQISGAFPPPKIIPFDFEAASVGPNSHIGSFVIRTPGDQPQILTPGSPILGRFKAGTMVFPYRLASDIFTQPAYAEIVFFTKEPNAALPVRRAIYTRFLTNGSPPYLKSDVNDPDYDATDPTRTICEGRKSLTIGLQGITTIAAHVRWGFGSPYDWSTYGVPISITITSDDPNNFSNNTALTSPMAITLAVPTGATYFRVINNVTLGLMTVSDLNTGSGLIMLLED